LGPILGKMIHYLNENPAFVRIRDDKAAHYSFKRGGCASRDKGMRVDESAGSSGASTKDLSPDDVEPSKWLILMWLCSASKAVLLFVSICVHKAILYTVPAVFVLAVLQNSFGAKEKLEWRSCFEQEDENAYERTQDPSGTSRVLRTNNREKQAMGQEGKQWQAQAARHETEWKHRHERLAAFVSSHFPKGTRVMESQNVSFVRSHKYAMPAVDRKMQRFEDLANAYVFVNLLLATEIHEHCDRLQESTRDVITYLKKKRLKYPTSVGAKGKVPAKVSVVKKTIAPRHGVGC